MGIFGRDSRTASDEIVPMEEPPVERPVRVQETPTPVNSTIIAEGIILTGNLQGEGIIHVQGTIEGEVKLQGRMTIAPTGVIKGPIDATAIQVAGSIQGNVVARDQLRLERTGLIEGDVTTGSFIIEDGGCLNGRTTMVKRERDSMLASPAKDALPFGPDYNMDEE